MSQLSVYEQVTDLLNRGVYTQAEIAGGINFSVSSISNFVSKNYGAKTEHIETALFTWLRRMNELRADSEYPTQYFETLATTTVSDVIEEANASGWINVCVGKPGVGKTMALAQWERRARAAKTRFCVITCNVAMSTAVPLLRKIAEALHLSTKGACYTLLDRILDKLKGEPTAIIIDEAQHLGLKGLEAVRAIHDETKMGITLLGSEALFRTLRDGDKSHLELQQLQDRIHRLELVRALTPTELRRFILNWWGKPLDEDVIGRLKTQSNSVPRRLVRILTHARALCEDGRPLSTALVDEATAKIFRKELA